MTAMTISDTERREVATRLRDKKAECEERGYPWMCDDLILALGYDHDYEAGDEIFDRLADLIEPDEPKVKCVAEVKVDGERLEKLAHDAAVELTGIDRDALLDLADEMDKWALTCDHYDRQVSPLDVNKYARRIRAACGEVVA